MMCADLLGKLLFSTYLQLHDVSDKSHLLMDERCDCDYVFEWTHSIIAKPLLKAWMLLEMEIHASRKLKPMFRIVSSITNLTYYAAISQHDLRIWISKLVKSREFYSSFESRYRISCLFMGCLIYGWNSYKLEESSEICWVALDWLGLIFVPCALLCSFFRLFGCLLEYGWPFFCQ